MALIRAHTMRPRSRRYSRREALTFYLFSSPWLIGFLVFSLGPILAAIYFSFTDLQVLNVRQGLPNLIGMSNYQHLFSDKTFGKSLEATAIWTIGGLAINTIVAILLAQLLNQRIPGIRLFRTFYYMPTVIAGVAAGYIWLFMLRREDGLINGLLSSLFGLSGLDWLGTVTTARISLLVYNLWYVGQSMVLYLAAIQAVPPALYEAASLDGAGAWRRLWNITLPMISPIILFNLVIGLINQLQAFIPAFVLTQGGPAYATWLYGYAVYAVAFTYQHAAYASAWAVVLFVLSVGLSLVLFLGASRFVYYQEGR